MCCPPAAVEEAGHLPAATGSLLPCGLGWTARENKQDLRLVHVAELYDLTGDRCLFEHTKSCGTSGSAHVVLGDGPNLRAAGFCIPIMGTKGRLQHTRDQPLILSVWLSKDTDSTSALWFRV